MRRWNGLLGLARSLNLRSPGKKDAVCARNDGAGCSPSGALGLIMNANPCVLPQTIFARDRNSDSPVAQAWTSVATILPAVIPQRLRPWRRQGQMESVVRAEGGPISVGGFLLNLVPKICRIAVMFSALCRG